MTAEGIQAISSPTHEEVKTLVESGTKRGLLMTLFGRCRVDYDGRAASTLGFGDRLVVLKPDGTVLVHTDEGHQPVNWQPPGCTHEVTRRDGLLVVKSYRENPDEELIISFERVTQATAFEATDTEELHLHGTEDDLRGQILEEPSLIESGFEPLSTERDTTAGAVDIYGTDSDENAVVIELKRRRVGPDAVSQLNRYVEALERELHAETRVRGILVAPSVTDRASELLAERELEFVSLSPTN